MTLAHEWVHRHAYKGETQKFSLYGQTLLILIFVMEGNSSSSTRNCFW